MNFRIIENGDKIDTMIGYLRILGRNDGNLIHVEEYEIAECGYPIMTDDKWMTIREIEREAKTYDGRNHNFIYQ